MPMVGITLYDRNHTDLFYQDGKVSHAIKMDRNHTCKLLFENSILHDCCVCNVHDIICPGNIYINVSYTWHHMVTKISTRLIGRLYQFRIKDICY